MVPHSFLSTFGKVGTGRSGLGFDLRRTSGLAFFFENSFQNPFSSSRECRDWEGRDWDWISDERREFPPVPTLKGGTGKLCPVPEMKHDSDSDGDSDAA